mmetsp:Transcript_19821/g.36752  ORF Transcript_19821/g.36752 Transcript_19821/m.36752 type:complete len:590 (-) Transcript_19821:160-1929(-)
MADQGTPAVEPTESAAPVDAVAPPAEPEAPAAKQPETSTKKAGGKENASKSGGANSKGEKGGKGGKGKKRYDFDDDDFVPPVGPDGLLKRMDRPDSDAKNANVNELTAKIDSLIEERNKIDKAQQIARAGNKPFNEKRKALITQLKDVRGKRKALMDAAQECKEKVDKIMLKEKASRAKEKQIKDQLKFNSVEDVDAKIKQLTDYHEKTSLSKEDERAVIKELSALQATRRKVSEFLQEKNANSGSQSNDIPTLRAEAKAKRAEADTYKEQIEKFSAELDKLTSENQANSSKADKLHEKRKSLQTQINALFAERDEVKKEFAKVWSRFKKYLDALNKQRAAERKARDEQYKKEREEYERKLEEEEMAKKPWESEIALCDMLINYLRNLQGPVKVEKTTVVENSAPAERQGGSEEAFSGMRAIGKKSSSQDDFLVMGGAKKKASKQKKKSAGSGKLAHNLDLLQSFSMLELSAPTKAVEIPDAITALKEKRAYYDVLPRAPRKKRGEAADTDAASKSTDAAPTEKKTNNKKKGNAKTKAPSVDSSELFPVLPGSKSPQILAQSPSGPSAVEMVMSNGTSDATAAPDAVEE